MTDMGMKASGVYPSRTPRERWSWRRRFVVTLAVLAIVLALPTWVLHRAGRIRRQSEIDAIRAAGEPMTFEDLDALRGSIPDAQNAALRIVPLFDVLNAHELPPLPVVGGGHGLWGELGVRYNAEMIEAIEAFLATRQEVLAELHAAAAPGRGAFPIEWTDDGFSTLLPHLSPVRAASKLLGLEAMVRAHRGNMDGAMASCESMFGVAACIEHEPFLVSLLVRCACESLAIETVQRTLALGEPDEARLRTFRTRLQRLGDDNALLLHTFFGERAIVMAFFSSARAGTISPMTPGIGGSQISIMQVMPGFLDLNEQKYLQIMRARCDAAKLPLDEAWPRMKELDGEFANLWFYHVLTRMILPSFSHATEKYVRGRVHVRAAVAGIEIELYRRANGRWPATLEEAFADDPARIPLDPFNANAPMRYIVDETGCTIYSIGADEADDGGAIEGASSTPPNDIGFRLLSPHLRGAIVTTQPVDKAVWEAIEALRAATPPPATPDALP